MFAIIRLPLFYFGPFLEGTRGSGAQSPYAPPLIIHMSRLSFRLAEATIHTPRRQAAGPPNNPNLKKSSGEKAVAMSDRPEFDE
jgi:hypothetical protein